MVSASCRISQAVVTNFARCDDENSDRILKRKYVPMQGSSQVKIETANFYAKTLLVNLVIAIRIFVFMIFVFMIFVIIRTR